MSRGPSAIAELLVLRCGFFVMCSRLIVMLNWVLFCIIRFHIKRKSSRVVSWWCSAPSRGSIRRGAAPCPVTLRLRLFHVAYSCSLCAKHDVVHKPEIYNVSQRHKGGPKKIVNAGGSVAKWLACWTQAQKGMASNCSRDAIG